MPNTEKIARKNKVAQDYIEKISNENYFDSAKEIDKSLSLVKKDIEKTGLTHKTKEALQDFLVTENIFEGFSDQIFKQNFSAIALMSADGKEKINKAKKIINNSKKSEQEVREELGLIVKNNKSEAENITEVMVEDQTEEVYTKIEKYTGGELLMIQKVTENKDQFSNKISEISKRLDINPNRLMWIMNKESGLNHKIQNKKSRATGLIQFMPKTAKGLGTTIKKLKNMTNIDQLDYVEKYYFNYKNKINSYEDLYLATFYPYAMDKSQDYIIGSEKGKHRTKQIGKQNPGMNNGNPITVANIKTWISNGIPGDYIAQFNGVEKEDNIEKYNISKILTIGDSHVGGLEMVNYPGDTKYFNGYSTGQLYKEISKGNINLDGKKAVVLYTGSNDISKNTTGSMGNNLEKIHKYLKNKGVNLILCTLPENTSKGENITKVNDVITKFAQRKSLQTIDINAEITIAQNEYQKDGVHFNSSGYKKISKHIEDQFT